MGKSYEKSDFYSEPPEPSKSGSPFPEPESGDLSPEAKQAHLREQRQGYAAGFDEAVKTFSLEQLGTLRKELEEIYDRFYRPQKKLLNPIGKSEHTHFLRSYNNRLDKLLEKDFQHVVVSTAQELELTAEGKPKVDSEDKHRPTELHSLHLKDLRQRLATREMIYQENVSQIITSEKEFHGLMEERKKMFEERQEPRPRSELDARWSAAARFVQQFYFGERGWGSKHQTKWQRFDREVLSRNLSPAPHQRSGGKSKELSKLSTEADLIETKRKLDDLIEAENRLTEHVDKQIGELADFLTGNIAYVEGLPDKTIIDKELLKFRNGDITWKIVLEKLMLDEEQNPRIPPSVRRDAKQRLLAIEQWVKSEPPQTRRDKAA